MDRARGFRGPFCERVARPFDSCVLALQLSRLRRYEHRRWIQVGWRCGRRYVRSSRGRTGHLQQHSRSVGPQAVYSRGLWRI